jgi:outer membrane protein TolC
MKKIIIAFFLITSYLSAFAQTYTLAECQRLARENHPMLKQAGVINELYQFRIKSLNSSNLPQIDFSGRASYQSDVTTFEFSIPGINIPEFSKDQYKIALGIRQKIYDFGANKNKKELEVNNRNIDSLQNEVELYQIKETVNTLYFNVLSINQNEAILSLKKSTLEEQLKVVGSAVRNGVSLPNNLDNLRAEELQTEQQQLELSINKQTALELLGIITGQSIPENGITEYPPVDNYLSDQSIERPDYKLFIERKKQLEQSKKTLNNSHLPYLYGFGQAGYGRPGLNMLSNDFDDWYMVGVGLSWNIWEGNKTKYDKAKLNSQQKSIDISKENFERNLSMSLSKELDNVKRYEALLVSDEELVWLKEQIAKRSESALANGTMTSADYLRDLNASLQAKASMEIHKLLLYQAKVNYMTLLGK